MDLDFEQFLSTKNLLDADDRAEVLEVVGNDRQKLQLVKQRLNELQTVIDEVSQELLDDVTSAQREEAPLDDTLEE